MWSANWSMHNSCGQEYSFVLVTGENGWSANMERLMKSQALLDSTSSAYMVSKKTLEVNPTNPIIVSLREKVTADQSDKTVKDVIWMLYYTSLLTSGFSLDGPTTFANRQDDDIEVFAINIDTNEDDLFEFKVGDHFGRLKNAIKESIALDKSLMLEVYDHYPVANSVTVDVKSDLIADRTYYYRLVERSKPPSQHLRPKRKHTREVNDFVKPASECTNDFNLGTIHPFVDLDRVVEACVAVVYKELNWPTTEEHRVPPLVLMRFARGGKTLTLARVFDRLKADAQVNPIMISFNGSGPHPFKQYEDETASQVILRLIATQLVDCSHEESLNLVVNREALDRHLGKNVVLLIDELNNLDGLDEEAAALLRELFLDPPGRFLVFTSHYPVSIEANVIRAADFIGKRIRPSNRGIITVNMSLALSLNDLRSMSSDCAALTEEEAAWLGYIPSLVYCTKNDSGLGGIVTPSMRFEQMHFEIKPDRIPDILPLFVAELLKGSRFPDVSQYYASFLSVGQNFLVSYPLCYVYEIFKKLNVNRATVKLIKILDKLVPHLESKDSGMAWECTVQVAIVLRMLDSHWSGAEFYGCDLVPFKSNPEVAFETLPAECHSLVDAKVRMDAMIAKCKVPTVIYVDSNFARFPSVECFVVYTANRCVAEAKIIGFQMKTSDVKPRDPIDLAIINGGAVLMRGRAKAKNPREAKPGWRYLTSAQVRDFIGNSLLLAMPRDWLLDP